MAWSTPLTAVSNTALTAAQWNASVRDNLAETAPAKATTAGGSIFVGAGVNSIAERVLVADVVETQQTTVTTTYVDLATVGPQAAVTSGTQALVAVSGFISTSLAGAHGSIGYQVSGSTTINAGDTTALRVTDGILRATALDLVTLTAGSNTFTTKYRSSSASSTATFANRRIAVIPL